MTEASELNEIEVWDSTTQATVWVWVQDVLSGLHGAWKHQAVGGPDGNPRLQLSVRERRYNQDRIPERNAHMDPFLNGQLVCRQGRSQSPNGYTDEQLITILQVESDEMFTAAINSDRLNEILLRRLLGLAERNARAYRYEELQDLVDERYRVGSTQRSLRDDIPDKGVGNGVLISG